MLTYRLIFGPVMIALALGMFWLDMRIDQIELTGVWREIFFGRSHPPAGLLLATVAVFLIPAVVWELVAMLKRNGVHASWLLISIASIAAALAMYASPQTLNAPTGVAILGTVLIATFIITLIWHAKNARTEGAIAAAGGALFAVVYIGMMIGFLLAIRRWHSGWTVLAVILITKSCDIGAYFTGRFFGKHKLIPWLSPKKTIEGLAGGVALSILMALLIAWVSHATNFAVVFRTEGDQLTAYAQTFTYPMAAVCGALFALIGHAGDLTVSLFKRDAGVKDSGKTIPGFGGVLDVLDSPLLVAPVAYWLLEHAIVRVPVTPH